MKYIYMNNYRGFDETLVPINDATFLVGENSTGKSSFLKLLYLIARPQFWFMPADAFYEDAEMGSFFDIVSASSPNQQSFDVGFIESVTENDKNIWNMALLTFKAADGAPRLSSFIRSKSNRLIKVIFEKKRTKYKVVNLPSDMVNTMNIESFMDYINNIEKPDNTGFKFVPKEFPTHPAIPIQVSLIESLEKAQKKPGLGSLADEFPQFLDVTWIAPIRTRPQRFYDGLKHSFSPEGEHTPFLLRRSLRARVKSSDFVKKISKFGQASGLFETVTTHSFDRSPQAPFEILVKFSDTDLNISNVGYGVSQVLPLVVEFLSKGENERFAVQQPEVHLHPRAQAALGDLLYTMAKEKGHTFVIETHSDFLIDRYRYALSKGKTKINSQVIFFSRRNGGNQIHVIPINESGQYPKSQPREFRNFFINEDLKMLDL